MRGDGLGSEGSLIGLKMACVFGEMKEESEIFGFWLEELGWRGCFLTTEQRVHKNSVYGLDLLKFEMSVRQPGEVQWQFGMSGVQKKDVSWVCKVEIHQYILKALGENMTRE